jgi:uncharacterized membrane protein
VLGIYAVLPVVAPVAMQVGATGIGNALYKIYSPMCHQFAYRSLFLFGEQPYYPRVEAQMAGYRPYELYLDQVAKTLGAAVDTSVNSFEFNAKNFIGNPEMGYKTAVCQRDVGIYLALFFGGLVYSIPRVRRHLRPIPIWLYVVLGVMPIGIDGFSQLLSQAPFSLWPARETTPFFRFTTGILFGLSTAWLAFPYLEASARETLLELQGKLKARDARQANNTGAQ